MSWKYQNKEITSINDMPIGAFGFVYEVEYIPTGEKYIGKKQLILNKKVKLGKKEMANKVVTRGRKVTTKVVTSESDWLQYFGSHERIKTLIKEGNKDNFSRTILQFAFNKKHLTYLEVKYQMIYEVLENSIYINDNNQSHFYSKDFLNLGD